MGAEESALYIHDDSWLEATNMEAINTWVVENTPDFGIQVVCDANGNFTQPNYTRYI